MLSSFEPATGNLLWEGPISDVADEIAIVERGWKAWAALPLVSRIEIIRRFANNVRLQEDKFAELIARETGRPIWDTKAEMHLMASQIDLAINALSERAGQRRLDGALGARQALRHRPLGIMAIIGPCAFPARIPCDQIVAALLAGNGVLFKPSEKTPLTGLSLVDLLHGAGVPQDLLRCVIGGPDSGKQLIAEPRINGVLFTGSTQNGLEISRTLARFPDKLLALNMSGNNSIIAWDVGDIASAAALIVQSAFATSGQNCLSARRLILSDAQADLLLPELARLTERLILDHPHADIAPFMGPVIDMDMADGLTDGFLYLMSHGGKPIAHMKRPFEGLPFISPGIIDVTAMEPRLDAELFGPLLQVIRVESFADAVNAANETMFGLSAALIGGSPEHYDYFWANSGSGIVNWNRPTTAMALAAPCGGTGLSGNHRPGGSYMADHCAYPVVSSALDQPRAAIGIGLKQPVMTMPQADAA